MFFFGGLAGLCHYARHPYIQKIAYITYQSIISHQTNLCVINDSAYIVNGLHYPKFKTFFLARSEYNRANQPTGIYAEEAEITIPVSFAMEAGEQSAMALADIAHSASLAASTHMGIVHMQNMDAVYDLALACSAETILDAVNGQTAELPAICQQILNRYPLGLTGFPQIPRIPLSLPITSNPFLN